MEQGEDCLVKNHMDTAPAQDNTTLDKQEKPEGAAAAAAPTTLTIYDITVNIVQDATQPPSAEASYTATHLLERVDGKSSL